MSSIRVKTHIDSEMLRLKELRPLIGKDVEISVRDAKTSIVVTIRKTVESKRKSKSTHTPKTGWYTRNFGAGSDMDFEGFDEAREKWRKQNLLTRDDGLKDLPE